jgi:hypothetical protein
LKSADYNPRIINEGSTEGLRESLSEFGDLSGITYNIRTGNLVTGHQRVGQLFALYGDVKFSGGKIVVPNGDEFIVRFVDWDLPKEKAANLAANSPSLQGQFTTKLTALLDEIKVELPSYFDNLRFDELYAVPITFDISSDFDSDDLRESFSSKVAGNSPYGSITIVIKRKVVEMVKSVIREMGKDKFSAAIVKMCRGLHA